MSANLKTIIKEEYIKCANNPVYFMKKYAKIQHPTKGKVFFDLYPFQEDVLKEFLDHQYNIVLKSRQLGISTLIAGYALWLMLFNSDKNVLVIATKQETAKNLVTKVRVMYDGLPSWLKTSVIEHNKLSLRFSNGSQIKAVSAAADAARSEALSLLVIDETAFIDSANEIWASAQQTLATGGQAILASTPNGIGNFFHKQWQGAENKENLFNPIKLPWTVHPERDQKWRNDQDIQLGPKLAAQETDCDFMSSGHSVVDSNIIQWYEQSQVKSPLEKRGIEDALWIWEYPETHKTYMVCADVARGNGEDYSAFHIIDIENIEQVAEYKGKLDTTTFGNILVAIATEYNDALLVIENATIGWAVVQQVINRGYTNLYYSYKEDGYVDPSIQIPKGYDLKDKQEMIPGFTTSSKTRPLIISKLETYFREKVPICRSQRLINELYVFIWHGSRAEAQSGYNDDLVMSFGIALWVRDSALKLRQQGLAMTRKSLDYMQKSSVIYNTLNNQDKLAEHGWKMTTGKIDQDLLWMLSPSELARLKEKNNQ